jgi:hypothetical protein
VGDDGLDGGGPAELVADRAGDRHRRWWTWTAAAGCAVALAVAVVDLTGEDAQEAPPPTGTVTGVPGAAATGDPEAGILDGPPRGSLAGDQAFLDGVRALPWTVEPPVRAADGTILYYLSEPPVESRRVVYAGDVPGGRWALVVAEAADAPEAADLPPGVVPDDAPVAAWFTGPPGAAVAQMTSAVGPYPVGTDWPLALTDPRTGALVVVAAPGDEVEVSERPLIDADGRTSREWRQLDAEDGVAVTRIPPVPRAVDASTSYRVLRGGRLQARDTPWSLFAGEPGAELSVGYLRGPPGELGELAARYAAEGVLRELGLPGGQVTITAQWVGSVPAGGAGRAAVVTVTLPGGAVVVNAQWLARQPDGSLTGSFCGWDVLPAGAPAERRVQAASCEVIDQGTNAPMSTGLVVVGPPEVALVRTYDGDRSFLSEHDVVDGLLVAPMPLGTRTVEAVTDGGVTLGRVDLLGNVVDFGD